MKILVVGAAGDIGRVVCDELGGRHDLIKVGRTSGDVQVDMSDESAVTAMYKKVGPVDAVVSAAGDAHFALLEDHTTETIMVGIKQKVMGQINLVLIGRDYINEGGSFTLSSGVLNRDPVPMGAGSATANGAIDGFVMGAAIDMPKRQRINVVSPGLLEVSANQYGHMFKGHDPVSSVRVGRAYAKCVEGMITGQIIVID